MDPEHLVEKLTKMSGVTGAVAVTTDGIVTAHRPAGEMERYGATAALLGAMAAQMRAALKLGALQTVVAELGNARVLVLEWTDGYVGLLLEEAAIAAAVATQARRYLS